MTLQIWRGLFELRKLGASLYLLGPAIVESVFFRPCRRSILAGTVPYNYNYPSGVGDESKVTPYCVVTAALVKNMFPSSISICVPLLFGSVTY